MKIALISLGCPKNQVDADCMAHALLQAGHTTVASVEEAQCVLINTCGFIESAKQEAIDTILEACSHKAQNPALKVVVTGCLAERYQQEIRKEIPEVDAVVGTVESCVAEARWLVGEGVKELIVVAQDITAFGADRGKVEIARLLDELNKVEGIVWIRLLYAYPERITDEFVAAMVRNEKVLHYLDVPIQHIDSDVLRAMNRKGDEGTVRAALEKLRTAMPDITLRTTLIAGFPGETPAQFEKLCAFVRQQNFARLGCFAYSEEEGTKAAQMTQMPLAVREQRAEAVMRIQTDHMAARQAALVGTQAQVLCDGWDEENGLWLCRTRADAPDIDAVVCVDGNAALTPGEFYTVRIIDSDVYDLYATLAE